MWADVPSGNGLRQKQGYHTGNARYLEAEQVKQLGMEMEYNDDIR